MKAHPLAMAIVGAVVLGLCGRAALADDVPAKYAQLYKDLSDHLSDAEAWLHRQGPERRHDTVFMTELLNANSNRGSELLNADTLRSCELGLERLHEIGCRGVKVSIQFPLLLPLWNTQHPNPPNTAYIDFYRKVGDLVRAKHMTLTVQMCTFFPQAGVSHEGFNYKGMTVEEFAKGLTDQARVILKEVKPDTLNILTEPSTQAHNTGLKLDPKTFLHVVQTVIAGCNRGRTKLAAGAGTWNKPQYFELLATDTSLDVIDMHIYTTADGELTTRVDAVDGLCRRNHKEIAVSECWLYKDASAQPTQNPNIEQSTCVWSFWEPLDGRFVRIMVSISRLYGLRYCSFFPGEDYFMANLKYGPKTANLSPAELKADEARAAGAAMRADTFSELGVDLAETLR